MLLQKQKQQPKLLSLGARDGTPTVRAAPHAPQTCYSCGSQNFFVPWGGTEILTAAPFRTPFIRHRRRSCSMLPIPTKNKNSNLSCCLLVRETGLEPVRAAPHAPQTCASADSATLAYLLHSFECSYTIPFFKLIVKSFFEVF